MVGKSNNFFDDIDIKTPLHDKMTLWTFENAEKIINKLELNKLFYCYYFNYKNYATRLGFGSSREYAIFDFEKEVLEIDIKNINIEEIRKEILEDYDLFNSLKISKERFNKIIEYPLLSYNRYNLGFIDLKVDVFGEGKKSKYFYCKGNRYSGFSDNLLIDVAFEIKPEVRSIGEILREFQYYKSHLSDATKLILVTKTKGLKSVFESQGFFVVEYEN